MEQLQLKRLPEILVNKINAGIDRLEKIPIDSPSYEPILANLEASLSLFTRLTMPPLIKSKEPKTETETINKTET